MNRFPFVMLSAVFVLSACNDDSPTDLSEVAENRAKWETANIDSYQFQRRVACFCLVEEPMVVTVTNGAVTSAFFTPSGVMVAADRVADLRTINGFFDLIESAIEQDVNRLSVTYDPTFGFPTEIFIDYGAQIADDEIDYFITEFQ